VASFRLAVHGHVERPLSLTFDAAVNKVIFAFKAPVAPEDISVIIDYLTNPRGTK
jgi:hypothetical protein